MTLKKKLLVTISMMALTIVMLMVGVWALKSTNFTVGGNINFTAKGVQATISEGVLSDTGSFDPSVTGDKMPQVKINTSHTQDQIDTMFEDWQGLHLLFNENGDDVTITFSITNDASYIDKALAVTVTPTTGTLNNATLSINTNSATILSGKSQEFVITFKVAEKTLNASIPTFSINFNLELIDFVFTDESQVSYLTFNYDHNNLTASVTNCAVGTATAEIPERVRHIYTNVNGEQVTAVYTVTSIADATNDLTGAFYATRSTLTSVSLPSTLTKIGDYAFYDCSKLTFTTYDNANYLGNEDNPYLVLHSTLNKTITSCMINDNCKFIYDEAFSLIDTLTNLTIPDSVIGIGQQAFSSCRGLESISIPDGVETIGGMAFGTCLSLKYTTENNAKYLGNENNPYVLLVDITSTSITSFTINDGCKVIYSQAFYYCSSLESIIIPDSVTNIGAEAFWGCSSLISVTIGSSVKSIDAAAFASCSNLTSITIPASVTSIGYQAFYNCSGLENVYYTGTEEQWNAISIGQYNTPLTDATKHYNYTGA